MNRFAPLLLAVAVGAASGLLGAWWPHASPEVQAVAPTPGAAPMTAMIEPDVEGVHTAAKRSSRVDVAVFCEKVPTSAEVSFRRFEQSTLGRHWSAPSKPQPTDARGQVVLPLSPGTWLLTARAAGCARSHQRFEVKEGLADQSIALYLEAGRALRGTIRDATTQQPIGGALITIRQQLPMRSNKPELSALDDAWTAVADSLGRYRIEGLANGELVVRASAEGFADAKSTLTLNGLEGKADLQLEPNGFIEGVVRGMTGPATVKDLRDDARTVFVNADGTFRLAVGPGPHLLQGEDSAGSTGLVRVNVPARATVRDVVLTLDAGGKIRGTASLGGAPAECARVWVRAESDPYEIASAPVARDGTFTLERVPPGRYWLFGECPGGEHGDVLGVEPGRDGVELTLKQSAGLVVRVKDAAGMPSIGTEVQASQPDREPLVAVTDAQGTAELSNLLTAVVRVEATAGTRQAPPESVQLVEGQAVAVELTIVDTGTIVGHIEAPAGLVEGINAFGTVDRFGQSDKVATDGSYSLRVMPGHYRVFPWLRGYYGVDTAKQVDVAANQEVRVDFAVTASSGRQLEASAPGTVGASFDDGPGGVAISWIISGSPVDKAGLKQGDLMLAIDGAPLGRSLDAFSRTKGAPGTPVRISYRRGGADAEVVVLRAGDGAF